MGRNGDQAKDSGERAGTLLRGLRLLDYVVDAPHALTLAELAAVTNLDQSTAHRILRQLEEAGYVVRGGASKRYFASPKVLSPLPLLHPLNQFRRESQPILQELAHRISHTVILVGFFGTARMVIDIAMVPGSVTPYYSTWLQGPLHATGVGKALLSGLTVDQRLRVLGANPLTRYTDRTIVDTGVLNEKLATEPNDRYVVSNEEYRSGITNIASVIRTWNQSSFGCLNLSAASAKLDPSKIEHLGRELAAAVDLITYQAPSLQQASQFTQFCDVAIGKRPATAGSPE